MGVPEPPGAAKLQIILAFDFGTRRIGVASGNTASRIGQPLCTLEYRPPQVPWSQLDQLLRDYLPGQLVVGVPYNDDGSATGMTEPAKAFAAELGARSRLPVHLVNEAHSSREAERELAFLRRTGLKTRRVSHADVDRTAARILLERWFAEHAS